VGEQDPHAVRADDSVEVMATGQAGQGASPPGTDGSPARTGPAGPRPAVLTAGPLAALRQRRATPIRRSSIFLENTARDVSGLPVSRQQDQPCRGKGRRLGPARGPSQCHYIGMAS